MKMVIPQLQQTNIGSVETIGCFLGGCAQRGIGVSSLL